MSLKAELPRAINNKFEIYSQFLELNLHKINIEYDIKKVIKEPFTKNTKIKNKR